MHRRSAPKVRNGKTQRKNRTTRTSLYHRPDDALPVIRRERPGEGFRHVITQAQLRDFIAILPDWSWLASGLNAVLIAEGREDCFGWHRPGTIAICAWQGDFHQLWSHWFISANRVVLNRLGVPIRSEPIYFYESRELEFDDERYQMCEFAEQTARGFLLMDVFLHELGHHHDRITTRSQRNCARGERYAEQYAIRYAETIWDRYFEVFGY